MILWYSTLYTSNTCPFRSHPISERRTRAHTSMIWGVPILGVPQNGWFIRDTPWQSYWNGWSRGYPQFRKCPYVHDSTIYTIWYDISDTTSDKFERVCAYISIHKYIRIVYKQLHVFFANGGYCKIAILQGNLSIRKWYSPLETLVWYPDLQASHGWTYQ